MWFIFFYKRLPYESCGDMHKRSYFYPTSPSPPQRLEKWGRPCWWSSLTKELDSKLEFFHFNCYLIYSVLLSHCLPIFLHSYLPPSATHPTFFFSFFISLFLFCSRLLLPLECLHWEIVCKGLPSLSTSSSEIFLFLDIYCTLQLPGYWCVPVCLNGCMCVCVSDHVCAHCCLHVLREKEAFQMTY